MRALWRFPLGRGAMALAVGLVLSLATACQDDGSQTAVRAGEADREGGSPVEQPGLGRCGERISLDPGPGGPLVLVGTFPQRVSGTGQDRFEGTVTVTNRGDAPIAGVAAGAADVFVTRSGQVVATPFDKEDRGRLIELAPGASEVFTATGRLLRCADETQRLAAGQYEIYALLSVTEGSEARTRAVTGGPWPLEVT
jgi:hypothetical protein